MKKVISLLACFLSMWFCIHAQNVTLVNCIDEGNFEILKVKENLDENNYLLYYLSALPYDSVSMLNNGHYWFNKINDNGSSVWKKEIPNSDKGKYVFRLDGWSGPITFIINDFPYKIYSKIDDELVLHYNYFDSVSTDTSRYATHHGNNLLDFGIINANNGDYKVPIFTIDTLVNTSLVPIYIDPDDPNPQIPKDTIVHISNFLINKINDSIYQMALEYSKYINYYVSYAFTNFYTINVNTKQVIRKQYEESFASIFLQNNRFYAIRYSNILIKINPFSAADEITPIPYTSLYLDYPQSRQLKFLSNPLSFANKTHTSLISIDTTTLLSSSIEYNNYIQDTSFISGFESLIPIDFPLYSNYFFNNTTYYDLQSYKKYNNKRFLLHVYGYYNSTNTYGGGNLISKVNLDNGSIEAKKVLKTFNALFYPTYISEPFRDDIFPNNDVLVPFDSITSTIYSLDTAFYMSFFSTHRFYLSRLDSSLNEKWITVFPDSVLQDTITYYCGIRSINGNNNLIYYPVNYKDQFIIGLSYGTKIDTIIGIYTPQIIRYFLVNNNTGEIRDMQLPLFLLQQKLAFFNSSTNDLSIITATNQCSSNYLDIGIYKYNDIINSVKPETININNFSVFPNPADAKVNIVLDNELRNKEINMRIIDISGKIVFANTLRNTDNYSFDVSKFSSGMYFIQLQTDDLQLTKKVQIIH